MRIACSVSGSAAEAAGSSPGPQRHRLGLVTCRKQTGLGVTDIRFIREPLANVHHGAAGSAGCRSVRVLSRSLRSSRKLSTLRALQAEESCLENSKVADLSTYEVVRGCAKASFDACCSQGGHLEPPMMISSCLMSSGCPAVGSSAHLAEWYSDGLVAHPPPCIAPVSRHETFENTSRRICGPVHACTLAVVPLPQPVHAYERLQVIDSK